MQKHMVDNRAATLNEAILTALGTYRQQVCFRFRVQDRYRAITYSHFQTLVFRLVAYFRQEGITDGARVALVADNSPEWLAVFLACQLVGGVAVPLRPMLLPNMLLFILRDCGASLAILQNEAHLRAIQDNLVGEGTDSLSGAMTLLYIDEPPLFAPAVLSLRKLLADDSTLALDESDADRLRREALDIPADVPALIHYVTSETRRPKGVVFTQAARLAAIRRISDWFPLDSDDLIFTVQPWSEMSSLLLSLYYFLAGTPNALGESLETLERDMHEASPTVMVATPFVLQQFYEAGKEHLAKQPASTRELFTWAIAQGKAYQAAGPTASQELRRVYHQAYATFFTRFQGMLGGRLRRFYSTGASLLPELDDFFTAIDLPVLNLYTMTEVGGFPAISRMATRRVSACGQIAPGFEIEIASDGEILVRSETLMQGYWQRPEETRQVLTAEGWLHSSDLGFVEDGYLYLTGRKPDAIVLSNGQKVAPAPIENILVANPFIAQALIFGDNRPYVTALLVPDWEAITAHLRETRPDEVLNGDTTRVTAAKALLDCIITETNERLDSWEQIHNYMVLDQPLTKSKTDPNSPQEMDRQALVEQFTARIEAMYPATTYPEQTEITQVHVDPERLQLLLQKERILDAWMSDAGIEFLLELAQAKGIDPASMVHICDTAATIAQLENEEKPLSTAIIVGDQVRIAQILPGSQIQLRRTDHIRRMRRTLISLAKMVDGLVFGYVVDKHGYVRGIRKLEVDLAEPSNFLLGPQFRRHAAISEQSDAVVFFVPLGGRQVRVFANGQMVGRYAYGDWSTESLPQIDAVIRQLAQQHNYDLSILRRILHCAFQMSEENLGAIFILGEADYVLDRADSPVINPYASIVSADITAMTTRELINFAKQDGATVIDMYGRFRNCMVLLRPKAKTQAEIGPGKGARHSSAAKISAECHCLAITVSQDGPITIYEAGKRLMSL